MGNPNGARQVVGKTYAAEQYRARRDALARITQEDR